MRRAGEAGAAETLAASLVRPEVRALAAYRTHDAAGLVKLDAMENPYPLPRALAGRLLDALGDVAFNRYPDPDAGRLKERLRAVMAVPDSLALVLGNGSDELIQTVALALARPGAVVVSPEPGFSMYRQIALTLGLRYVGVDLRAPDFSLDLDAMLDALASERPAVVFIAYPNNPTGNLFDADSVRAVIRAAPGIVVIDEAYAPFARASFLPEVEAHPNLMVMRTVSKLGLAGLRLGMLAAHPAWAAELEKLRLPYNVNALSQCAARFALAHHRVLDEQTERISADRERLFVALRAMPGVTAWPSRANFLLFRCRGLGGGDVFDGLVARGVLVRRLDGSSPALAGCLRVTVGRPAENRAFLAALADTIEALGGSSA